MTKYILKKDLPNCPAGKIFEKTKNGYKAEINNLSWIGLPCCSVENNEEWFEEWSQIPARHSIYKQKEKLRIKIEKLNTCNQCFKQMKIHKEFCVCANPNCLNYALYQASIEQMEDAK